MKQPNAPPHIHLAEADAILQALLGGEAVAVDVTERKPIHDQLRPSEELFRTLVTTADDIVTCIDPQLRITQFFARGLAEEFAVHPGVLVGKTLADLVGNELAQHEPAFRRALAGSSVVYDWQLPAAPGPRYYQSRLTPVRDENGNVVSVVGVGRDVTALKQAEAELRRCAARLNRDEATIRHMAYHDSLTSLPNRKYFQERLDQEVQSARRGGEMLAVMFLDLDRIKRINDTLGHAIGDQLLQHAAGRLKRCLGDEDMVARMGGDEFTVLLPRIPDETAPMRVANKIAEELSRPFHLGGRKVEVTASIGTALYPGDGADAETLLTGAATAMYRAKERGRNNSQLYTPAIDTRIAQSLALETDLRHALDDNQLEVWYQPQVNGRTGRIVGVEALVRWRHPEQGLIQPGQFIPMAEASGLIVPLGEWVLATACAQAQAWQEAGIPPLRLAVNLSPVQFQQPRLVERIQEILAATGFAPQLLELEITEGSMVQDVPFAIKLVEELRAMGVQIALDDYGTGYSALAHLKRFPIGRLKIAQEFVHDLTPDSPDASIVRSILSLARHLKLQVIAEGVETAEQDEFLRKHHCPEMQGYLFGRPVPADALTDVLRAGKIQTSDARSQPQAPEA